MNRQPTVKQEHTHVWDCQYTHTHHINIQHQDTYHTIPHTHQHIHIHAHAHAHADTTNNTTQHTIDTNQHARQAHAHADGGAVRLIVVRVIAGPAYDTACIKQSIYMYNTCVVIHC